MSILVQASMPFTATASGAPTGLVGTIGVRVVRSDGSTIIARTTSGIIELVAGSGAYAWSYSTAPSVPGSYDVVWDTGSESFAVEDMLVSLSPVATGGAGAPPYPSVSTITDRAQQKQRAVRGAAFTAQYVFGLDDDALPDSDTTVNVSVINAEGYLVVDDESATVDDPESGTQTVTFVIPAASTGQRDVFTCVWTATIGSASVTAVSVIDVCDNRLFPASDYLQYPEIQQRGFSADVLERERLLAEDFLERECGRAFTGRYVTEQRLIDADRHSYWYGMGSPYGPVYRGRGVGRLPLRLPYAQSLRSIVRSWIDDSGNPQTYNVNVNFAHLDTFSSVIEYHSQRSSSQWDGLWGNLTIGYEHGASVPDVRRVCAMLARHRLLKGPLDDRATQMSVAGGGTINLLTPGIQGSVTGIAEVDVFIERYNAHAILFVSGG